ncbi:MAG: calcium-binding protein [Marinovum sp.]|nr:calcium-binding protein [Marinovum sp.]
MARTKSIAITSVTLTQHSAGAAHFGGNALHGVNISEEGVVTSNFAKSAASLGLSDLRYPGGFMEDEGDLLTDGSTHALAPHLVNFLDWVRAHNRTENPYTVTLGIPTKNLSSKGYDSTGYAQKVYDFAGLLGRDYADVVKAVEIGNEYSIGAEWLSETAYGSWANIAAEALENGFQAAGINEAAQPKILMQMAEIFGHGSDYSGTGNHNLANAAIIKQLDQPAIKAIDGLVQHYYYIKDHHGSDDFASSGNGSGIQLETRYLQQKIAAWEQQWAQVSARDLDLVFTEWNVQKSDADQLGLKGAGTLLKQFEYMLELGVDAAHAWPIQHKTPNSLAGNPAETAELTPAGGAFKLLSQNFANSSGATSARLLKLNFDQKLTGLETVALRQDYKTLLYMASRTAQTTQVTIDLRGIAPDITTVSAVILGYDPASSDGLSEMGDSNHKNHVTKRQISYIEYLDLKSLAFFDDTNQDHITVKETSGGEVKYLTYLPQFDDILPKNSDPKTIEDYYFASETDVSASYKHLSQAELGSPNSITFQLNPYEVVELSIGHSTKLADLSDTSDASGIAALPSAPGRIKIDGSIFIWTAGQGQIWTQNDFADTKITDPSASSKSRSVFGDNAANKIQTGAGADVLSGGGGDDILLSAGGDDFITRGAGNGRIDGGSGSDTIEGGSGADSFVFRNINEPDRDMILDFDPVQDTLIMVGISSHGQLGRFKDILIVETAKGSEIIYGDYRLNLIGKDAAQFSIDDIIFI